MGKEQKYEARFNAEGQLQYGGTTKFREELGYRQILMWQINRINLAGSEALIPPVSHHMITFSLSVDILEGCLAAYLKEPPQPLFIDTSNMNDVVQQKVFADIRNKYIRLIVRMKDLGLLLEEIGDVTL